MRDSTAFNIKEAFEEGEACCVAALVVEAVDDEILVAGQRTAVVFVDFSLDHDVLAALRSLGKHMLNASARCSCMDALDGCDIVAFWRWDVSVDATPPIDFVLTGLCNLDQADLLEDAALVLLTDADASERVINEDNFFIALPWNALRWARGPLAHRPA